MSSPTPSSIRTAPVVAVVLGIAAVVLGLVAAALQPIALILAIAGIVVGGVAAYNHRRDRINLIAAGIAVAVSLVALIVVTVAIAS